MITFKRDEGFQIHNDYNTFQHPIAVILCEGKRIPDDSDNQVSILFELLERLGRLCYRLH